MNPEHESEQSFTQDRGMPSRSPEGNRKNEIHGEATHPDRSPPRRPDHDLVAAVPVLGHLQPRALLRAMPHAHQPERRHQHRRRVTAREPTDQSPTTFPAHASEREHTSARVGPRAGLQPPTNLVPGSRTGLPPALHYHRPQQSDADSRNNTGRHWNSLDVTASLQF